MDYDAFLEQHCPIEWVERVETQKMGQFPTSNVLSDAVNKRMPQECIKAIIAWPTPQIEPKNNPQAIRNWLSGLLQWPGTLPDDFRKDVRAALLRIGFDKELASLYFLVLRHHRIDLREELEPQIVPDWTFSQTPSSPGSYTWPYTMYLAALDTEGAYDALADKIAATPDANMTFILLSDLSKLQTQQARQILERYRNDTRNITSPGGRTTPLGNVVQITLDHGVWQ